ncbi:uncharacterized protein LOC134848704 [Symsagittifera roscoffensis]|uniref:uncharacterized protein LOC134848704 n=1 Tax=Symsagittifera roscoffensis TaxID=84072 RepID=UPI00307B5E9E
MSRQLSFPIALAAALLLAITHNFPFFQLATASQNHPENSYSVNSPLELPQSSNSYPEFSEIETRQDNMGACGKNPCMNGGNCNVLATGVGGGRVSKDEMFVCHCMTGFYGRKCEKGSGVSLNCTDTEMSVSVAHSLTVEESLVLNDGQCELRNDTEERSFHLQFQFSSCGTIQQIKAGKEVVYRQVINKKSEVGNTNIISREGELAITRDSRYVPGDANT